MKKNILVTLSVIILVMIAAQAKPLMCAINKPLIAWSELPDSTNGRFGGTDYGLKEVFFNTKTKTCMYVVKGSNWSDMGDDENWILYDLGSVNFLKRDSRKIKSYCSGISPGRVCDIKKYEEDLENFTT